MSFGTHHRISRQKANYMDNLSVKVLVPSFLRMETSSFIRSDEQISRIFVSKTRDDFSESSFGTHCCPRTEFKKKRPEFWYSFLDGAARQLSGTPGHSS